MLSVSLLDGIQCSHRAIESKFLLVSQGIQSVYSKPRRRICFTFCITHTQIHVHRYTHILTHGLGVRVFANGPGDLGSIPGRVIPKTQKMVLDASLLSTQHYKVRIKGKVEQSRKGVAPSPTHWCSSYRKGSLRVTLDYGRQLYFTYTKRFIYLYCFV